MGEPRGEVEGLGLGEAVGEGLDVGFGVLLLD